VKGTCWVHWCVCHHVVDVRRHSARAGAEGPNACDVSRRPPDVDVASRTPRRSSPAATNAVNHGYLPSHRVSTPTDRYKNY